MAVFKKQSNSMACWYLYWAPEATEQHVCKHSGTCMVFRIGRIMGVSFAADQHTTLEYFST